MEQRERTGDIEDLPILLLMVRSIPARRMIGFATEFIGEFTQWSLIRMRIGREAVTIKPRKVNHTGHKDYRERSLMGS
jgi:hypothetical protein